MYTQALAEYATWHGKPLSCCDGSVLANKPAERAVLLSDEFLSVVD